MHYTIIYCVNMQLLCCLNIGISIIFIGKYLLCNFDQIVSKTAQYAIHYTIHNTLHNNLLCILQLIVQRIENPFVMIVKDLFL